MSPYRKFKREGDFKCKKEHASEKFYDATVFLFSDVIVVSVKMTGKSVVKYPQIHNILSYQNSLKV